MKRPLTLRLAVGLLLCPALAMAGAPASQAAPADLNYYYTYFNVGAQVLPHTDTDWVPQGLAADTSAADNLIVSYYDSKNTQKSILDIIDRTTRARIKTLRLDFVGHVGGVAMTSEFLWITRDYGSSAYVVRYDRSVLDQDDYSTIRQTGAFPVKANSYACAESENLWVGHFDPDHRTNMHRYKVSSTGQLTFAEDVYTPSRAQGCVVTGTRVIWSQSYDRDYRSKIIVWPRGTKYDGDSDTGRFVTAPNMSQGLTYVGGRVYVAFESGSNKYDGTADKHPASYIIRSVHDGSIPPLP